MAKSLTISTLAATVILFFWSGIAQNLPWGSPIVQAVSSQRDTKRPFEEPGKTIFLPAGTLVTPKFEEQMVGKISRLTSDSSFHWIISVPLDYYGIAPYCARGMASQFVVALMLSLLLWNLRMLDLAARIRVVFLAAVAGAVATHFQEFNWMWIPPTYALGVAFNLIVGWVFTAYVLSKWILKPEPHESR